MYAQYNRISLFVNNFKLFTKAKKEYSLRNTMSILSIYSTVNKLVDEKCNNITLSDIYQVYKTLADRHCQEIYKLVCYKHNNTTALMVCVTL